MSDQGSKQTLLLGVAAVLVAFGILWLLSGEGDEDEKKKISSVAAEKVARPLNKRKRKPDAQRANPKTVPIRLSPALQKRLGAPKMKSPLAPNEADRADAPSSAAEPSTDDLDDDTGNTDDANAPNARTAKKKNRGSLSKESIQAGIRAIRPNIISCFEQGLKHNRSLAGKVVISFDIEANDEGEGKVVRGEVKDSEVQSPFFEACVLKEIGGQTFDAPEGGGAVSVSYPFNFDPGGGFGAAPPGQDDNTESNP